MFEDVCTFDGIYVPCICLHARCSCGICWAWELPLFLKSFFSERLLLRVPLSVTCILSEVLMCQFSLCLLLLVSQVYCSGIVSSFVCLAVLWTVLSSALSLCWLCLQEEHTTDSFIKFQVLRIPGWGPDQQNVSGPVPVCFAMSAVGAVLMFSPGVCLGCVGLFKGSQTEVCIFDLRSGIMICKWYAMAILWHLCCEV